MFFLYLVIVSASFLQGSEQNANLAVAAVQRSGLNIHAAAIQGSELDSRVAAVHESESNPNLVTAISAVVLSDQHSFGMVSREEQRTLESEPQQDLTLVQSSVYYVDAQGNPCLQEHIPVAQTVQYYLEEIAKRSQGFRYDKNEVKRRLFFCFLKRNSTAIGIIASETLSSDENITEKQRIEWSRTIWDYITTAAKKSPNRFFRSNEDPEEHIFFDEPLNRAMNKACNTIITSEKRARREQALARLAKNKTNRAAGGGASAQINKAAQAASEKERRSLLQEEEENEREKKAVRQAKRELAKKKEADEAAERLKKKSAKAGNIPAKTGQDSNLAELARNDVYDQDQENGETYQYSDRLRQPNLSGNYSYDSLSESDLSEEIDCILRTLGFDRTRKNPSLEPVSLKAKKHQLKEPVCLNHDRACVNGHSNFICSLNCQCFKMNDAEYNFAKSMSDQKKVETSGANAERSNPAPHLQENVQQTERPHTTRNIQADELRSNLRETQRLLAVYGRMRMSIEHLEARLLQHKNEIERRISEQ